MEEWSLVSGRAHVRLTVAAHPKTGNGEEEASPDCRPLGICLTAGSRYLQSFQSLWL